MPRTYSAISQVIDVAFYLIFVDMDPRLVLHYEQTKEKPGRKKWNKRGKMVFRESNEISVLYGLYLYGQALFSPPLRTVADIVSTFK